MRRTVHALLDLVFAPVCLGCDALIAPGDTARLMCRRCRTRLRAPTSPTCFRCGAPLLQTGRRHERFDCPECSAWPDVLRFARSACLMEPPADRFVHQLKYRGWRALAQPMTIPMSHMIWPDEVHEPAVITPVPTTPKRMRERGYNQAELLATALASATGREMHPFLDRAFATKTQTTLQPAARAANVAGAFAGRSGVSGAHVILVDDVLTTGATAAECARTLAIAGACCVRLITFARASVIRGPA